MDMPLTDLEILVLSDDRLFRDGVLRILGDAGNLTTTVHLHDDGSIAGAAGHITIVDARMGGAIRSCAELSATSAVILVGAPDEDDWALEALSSGARGIVTKASPSEDLLRAIRIIVDGGIWARRRWLTASLSSLAGFRRETTQHVRLSERLSRREREVFQYAARGLGNKQLADRLAISEATVKAHLSHIFQKLGVSGRAELAAAYHGLLETAPGKTSGVHRTS